MADKLSESIWTAFLKKQKIDLDAVKIDDKPLVKALAAFDKTDESKPEPRLKAFSKKRGKALAAIGALSADMSDAKAELQGRMDVIDAGAEQGYFKNQLKLLERILTDAADARKRQTQLDVQQAALESLVQAAPASKGKGKPDAVATRLDEYARLTLEAQASFTTYDAQCPALKTYFGTLTTEILQDIQNAPRLEAKAKDDLRDAKALKVTKANEKQVAEAIAKAQAAALTAPEQANNLTGLKKQLEEQWGPDGSTRRDARSPPGTGIGNPCRVGDA